MNTVKIDNYTFDKAARTVTLTDFTSIRLDQIVSITDVTNNVQIFYNKLPNYGGEVSANVITLDYDTTGTGFDNTDKLCIEVVLDNYSITALPSAVRTVDGFSDPVINYGCKGLHLIVNTTAAIGASPELTVKLQMMEEVTGDYVDIQNCATTTITGAGKTTLTVYPGVVEAANQRVSNFLPRKFRVAYAFTGTTTSFTFSVSANLSK